MHCPSSQKRDSLEPPHGRLLKRWAKTQRGSLLLEGIIAIGIFALFLSGVGLSLVAGERSTIAGGDRARAGFLAEEQLEAVRHMQKNNFSSLVAGTYGLTIKNGTWAFSGTSITLSSFRASVVLTSFGTDRMQAASRVAWNFGRARSGSVLLTTYLTNWRKQAVVGNWANTTQEASITQSGSPTFQRVAVSGDYVFVTSSTAAGLYIYNITTTTAPVRVASAFSLDTAAYGVVAVGDRLYLATGNSTQEVMVFDISDPTHLSFANLLSTYNLPGSAGARSIAVYGNTIYVGTVDDSVNHQFYALSVSETSGIELLSSLATSGSVLDINLSEGYAYIASSNNVAELQVIDIIDSENVQYAPGTGIDMTNTFDGLSFITSGTSALIGRANGSAIEELVLYDVGSSPVPSPPPGPWALEIGGNANVLAIIEGTKYIFVGGNASATELRVVDLFALSRNATSTLKTIDVGATINGLTYDWVKDRLFAVTPTKFIVYKP